MKKDKTTQGKVEPPKPWPAEPGKSLRSQLWDWLKEITPRPNAEDYCQIMADSVNPTMIKVRIFTHDYRYSIFVTKQGLDEMPMLACTATRRKSLAGLTEHTYADLVDGKFCRVTWELIKASILRFELVKLTAKAKELGTKEVETSRLLWKKLCSHYVKAGRQFYTEWLQRGEETREHKIYELVGTASERSKE